MQYRLPLPGCRRMTVRTVPPALSLNYIKLQAVFFGRVVPQLPPTESYTNRFLSLLGL